MVFCIDGCFRSNSEYPVRRNSHPTAQRLGYATGAAYGGIVANAVGFAEAAEPAKIADAAVAIFAASLVFAAIGLAATERFVFLGSKGHANRARRRSEAAF